MKYIKFMMKSVEKILITEMNDLKKHIISASKEIEKLSDEEFEKELEKYSNGDIAIALIESGAIDIILKNKGV